MEVLQQLETYITAQKNVAFQFIMLGAFLIILALLLQFLGKSNLSSGLKIGALICGLFILVGGIAYNSTENKLLQTQTSLYQKSKVEFQQVEIQRMAKVKKDYPIYQMVFGGLIILSLLVVWFAKNPFWHGIAFSAMILFIVIMIIEAYSQRSINLYYQSLIN